VAPACPGPNEIFEHYRRSVEAFSHLKQTIRDFPDAIGKDSRFWAMTTDEIDEAFRKLASELDIQINLLLIASCEASLRIDFVDRLRRRKRDNASRRFKMLDQERKARAKKGVRLEEILNVWAKEPTARRARELGSLLLYRHWIAHGRYWVEKKSGLNDPDPNEVWNIILQFLNSLPGFAALPDG
jgi:hypothetical protein